MASSRRSKATESTPLLQGPVHYTDSGKVTTPLDASINDERTASGRAGPRPSMMRRVLNVFTGPEERQESRPPSPFQLVTSQADERPSGSGDDYYVGQGGKHVRIRKSPGPQGSSFTRLLSKFESLDYDEPENTPYLREERKKSIRIHQRIDVMRWVVMFLIGVTTALIACFIDVLINLIAKWKFRIILNSFNKCVKEDCLPITFVIWMSLGVGLVLVAALLVVYVEPVAAGSGIPEIKCFLNGVKIPHVVRFKTLFCKAIGILFSVAGGLPVGKEGPMIHSGAVVAAGISQGRSEALKKDFRIFRQFRLDHEKRDFVSGGAAAGVAAAFGAPVGGVLFSLEEGASFWNQSLTWRMFFAAMCAVYTLNLILSAWHGHVGDLSYNGLLNFGTFSGKPYYGYELLIFMLQGVIGGALGALFNGINHKLSIFRRRYVNKKWKKLIEPLLMISLVSAVSFLAMIHSHECHFLGQDSEEYIVQPQLFCNDGEYNAMGTLLIATPEDAVKTLFHAPTEVLSMKTVFVFASFFFILSCWTYGLSVPSGLFVPCILLGAAWGRGIGLLVRHIMPFAEFVEPGKYALIGAAAMLGGVVRMTISLTVIIVESTGDVTYGLPIMLTVMIAKWVGDIFNEGLYDIHIDLQGVPLLGWTAPQKSIHLSASDIMTAPVSCLRTVEKVGTIAHVLETTKHNGFPVVVLEGQVEGSRETFGHFRGVILRSQLIVLLQNKVFQSSPSEGESNRRPLSTRAFQDIYPRMPSLRAVHLSLAEREDRYVDLTPYYNPMPYTVDENSTMPHVFKLFRALGLRHIVVIDKNLQVVGIVTRKDLARYRTTHGYSGKILKLEIY